MSNRLPSPKCIDDLFARSIPEPNTGCWLWERATCSGGYGQVGFGGRVQRAHRVAAILAGLIVDGRDVCHRCDTPACCNPEHLFVGSHREHMRDAADKGRMTNQHANKSACKNGHPFEGDNLRTNPSGHRYCRQCARDFGRRRYWRGRADALMREGS